MIFEAGPEGDVTRQARRRRAPLEHQAPIPGLSDPIADRTERARTSAGRFITDTGGNRRSILSLLQSRAHPPSLLSNSV